MPGEGAAGALLIELQIPHDRLGVSGTACELLLSRLALSGGTGIGSGGSVGLGTWVRGGAGADGRVRGVLALALALVVGYGRHQCRALKAVLVEVVRGVVRRGVTARRGAPRGGCRCVSCPSGGCTCGGCSSGSRSCGNRSAGGCG